MSMNQNILKVGFVFSLSILFFTHPSPAHSLQYDMDYTSSGFNPSVLTSQVGDTLTIYNQSDIILDLYSAPSTSQIQTQALEVAAIEPGSTFTLIFTTTRSHLFFNLNKPDTFSKVNVFDPPPSQDSPAPQGSTITPDELNSGLEPYETTQTAALNEYNNSSNSHFHQLNQMITQNTQKLGAIAPYFRYVFYVTFTISFILTIGFIQHLFFLKLKRSNQKRKSLKSKN